MSIAENLETIHENIKRVCQTRTADSGEVRLVAVSKYHTVDEIKEAYADGQRVFGENRVQELLPKIEALAEAGDTDIQWHLIGHLQKNKVRQVVDKVAMIESVDSIGLLEEIEKRAAQHDCEVNILLQVNVAQSNRNLRRCHARDQRRFLHGRQNIAGFHKQWFPTKGAFSFLALVRNCAVRFLFLQ